MIKFKHQIIMFFLVFFGLACNKIPFKSNDCSQYFDFIKKNWVLTDKKRILYHFKDKPDFGNWDMNGEFYAQKRAKYFQPKCLIGLNKKQIISIFGMPSKKVSYYNNGYFDYWIYGMDKKCLKLKPGGGTYIVFDFNREGHVSQVHLAPLGFEKSHCGQGK